MYQLLLPWLLPVLHLQGADPSEVAEINASLERAFSVARLAADDEAARAGVAEALAGIPYRMRPGFVDIIASDWGRDAATHDPIALAASYPGPIPALFGGTDIQVNARANAGPFLALAVDLGEAGRVEARILSGLNHLFQPSACGATEDHARIEITMAGEALGAVAGFLSTALETEGRASPTE